MARYEQRNFVERTEVMLVFLLIGSSYFLFVAPLLADVHPIFATADGQLVADRFLNSPRDWAVIPYMIVGIWLYVRARRRLVGQFETLGTQNE